ncbi:HAD-IA family hydrolase [Idiomarina loihiensis]|jgi:phosphoglycolate phosphatase|uniref:HAD-IA family hydrolase n=1 Tax=Idiomarina TaxID=135575 RepID=UPI000C451E4D|nr:MULTISPECIES: HAD-IA family hydrolase [unclassified Idiomarina]MAA61910.1 HAD family hydrolase [Idiomarina sp.]TDO53619.1 phosphoglycolate phosphatase [Idiomarina sp. 017G]|tara:strand:- start:18030 stop:18692 length:663 start_codon:yes stop_codon:yes gene_type:complete
MMYDKRLVVFDWDGTLMDSIGRIVSSMQNTAQHTGLPVPTEISVRDIIGLSLEPAIEKLFGVLNAAQLNSFLTQYRDEYVDLNTTPSPLFHDAKAVLSQLSHAGYRLAVATGKARRGLQRVWAESETEHYFDTSRCASETKGKPDPQMLYEIMNELKTQPEHTLMVGDSVHDMKMAVAAGVQAIGVSFGVHDAERLREAGATIVVDSLSELSNKLVRETL